MRSEQTAIGLFISLLAQRNEPKKGHPCPLSRRRRDALRSSMLPGLCKLAALKQCKSLFGSLSGARLRANGIFPSLPHLSCRASQTRAEKTLKLSEGEARVF
jgi:hypothetical protein